MKIPASAALFAGLAVAHPNCPRVHIIGARETTAPQSNPYGTATALVNQVLATYPGSAAEAIVYPACSGQEACGGVQFPDSVAQGTAAVIKAVNTYNAKCPHTQIILIGYSQGGHIMDNAICGGLGETLTSKAVAAVKAAVFLGPTSFSSDLSYSLGTCNGGGASARPAGFKCAPAKPSIVKSWCDDTDQFCCGGTDIPIHFTYTDKYGADALAFIKSRVPASKRA